MHWQAAYLQALYLVANSHVQLLDALALRHQRRQQPLQTPTC